jgi:hypothetical protein
MSRIPSVTAVVTGFNPTKQCLACGEILITDIAADISILDPEDNEGI